MQYMCWGKGGAVTLKLRHTEEKVIPFGVYFICIILELNPEKHSLFVFDSSVRRTSLYIKKETGWLERVRTFYCFCGDEEEKKEWRRHGVNI